MQIAKKRAGHSFRREEKSNTLFFDFEIKKHVRFAH